MLYRRTPFNPRGFSYPNENLKNDVEINIAEKTKELDTIPLPNEESEFSCKNRHISENRFTSFINTLSNQVPLEEIMLIGLIFLLFDESLEDDLLLVILIYVFMTGMKQNPAA